MATVSVLESVKVYLEREVAATIKLQIPSDENILAYELAHPTVFVGWVPPKGLLSIEPNFPCLVVGFDQGKHQTSKKTYNLRISAAVYSPGTHELQEGVMTYKPNYQGYIDLLNLIDRTINCLIKSEQIETLEIAQDISWSMYDEQPYPYWYGYISLTLHEKVSNSYEKLL